MTDHATAIEADLVYARLRLVDRLWPQIAGRGWSKTDAIRVAKGEIELLEDLVRVIIRDELARTASSNIEPTAA
jgi:hypothetical protein